MSFEEMQSILQGILLSQQQFQIEMVETKAAADRAAQVAESNGRAIQAMLDNAATDRLQHEERMERLESLNEENNRRHEERMARLESISLGLVNLSSSIDEDRPTILRLLNSNNNKLDLLLDRLPPQQ
jgi:GTP1/Obg family GTP-binding protein